MGKKAKKKTQTPARASHAKNVSEQSSRSEETVEDAVEGVKEKQSCVHFTKGVKLDKVLSKIKTSEHIECGECKEGAHERRGSKGKGNRGKKGGSSLGSKSDKKAIWVCLECGHYVCGGVGLPTGSQSHVVRHIRLTRHRLVIQWENPQLRWCFPCNALLPVDKGNDGRKDVLSEVVQLIKERSLNTLASAGSEDLSSGSGSITSEIKSQGIISSGIEARDGYVVCGLVNLGNTCFFNSIMQNLLSLDQLRERLLNEDVSGGGPVFSSLKKLFAETKPEVGSKSVINPRSFFGSICAKAPQFRGYQQHDSHELLRCLLDGLSTEESSLRKKLGASDTDGNSTYQKPTLVDTVFGGEISSTLSCMECGHSSKVYEPFLDLSLPVPTKKPPRKKQQILSRAKKTKLSPKRVPKTRAKVSKDSGYMPADAASKHLDVSLTGKAKVATGDSSTSGSIAPTSRSIENGPVSEEEASGIASRTETVFDSFWLDILGPETLQDETRLDIQADNDGILSGIDTNGSVLVPETTTDAPVSLSCETFEGGKEPSMDTKDGAAELGEMQDNDKLASRSKDGVSLETNRSNYVGWDPGLGHSSSYVNPWDDEELPLQVADSEVLYMPYKEESSCTDKTLAEAAASSSHVSHGQDQDMDFDGFGGLFDEPEISEGPVSEAGFMAVSSESDPEEIDDSDSPVSVERCLAHFTKPEILSDDNAWNCENCSKNLKMKEKKRARDVSRMKALGDKGINENGTSRASHDRENNPSHRHCINLENGHKDDLGKESSNCKEEKNAMDNGVVGNSNVLGSKQAPGDSCGIKGHKATANSILEREAIDSQLTDDSQSEGRENEAVNSGNATVKRDATKRVLIKKAPPVLTIHLKRFSQDARGRLSKLNGHVAFKEFIDLRSYMDSRFNGEEKPIYRLAGVVEHSGTMRGGHYVAYVRGGQKSRRNSKKETDQSNSSVWFHVSDSYVRQVSWEEVLRCEAYIFFYERI